MAAPPTISRLDQADLPNMPDADRLMRALNPFMGSTVSALARGLTFRENFACALKTLEVTAPDDWKPLDISTYGLTPQTDPSVIPERLPSAKWLNGDVLLRGLAKHRATNIMGYAQAIAKLPAGLFGFGYQVTYYAGTASVLDSNGDTGLIFIAGSSATPSEVVSFDGIRLTPRKGTAPPQWTAPVEFTVPDGFPGKPGAVLVWRCEELGRGAPIEGVAVPGFQLVASRDDEKRQIIRLPRITGLTPTLKYRLTLLILPE